MDVESGNIFPKTKVGRDHQMRDMFRNGKVIDRKFDKDRGPLVRVQYLDRQGLVSYWFPVKQFGSRKTLHYYCPKIGDDVNVTMLPNGSENGFVDGSFFNKANPPPELDIDTRHYQTEDGTIIEYRESDSTFLLDVSGAGSSKGPSHRAESGGVIVIVGDIQHTGNMVTSGIHTDANGIHTGGMERDDLVARIEALEREVRELRAAILQ